MATKKGAKSVDLAAEICLGFQKCARHHGNPIGFETIIGFLEDGGIRFSEEEIVEAMRGLIKTDKIDLALEGGLHGCRMSRIFRLHRAK